MHIRNERVTFARKNSMDTKKINFVIDHFGCYTLRDGERLLTSLGTMSIVPSDKFWNVFTGDANRYFSIRESEVDGKLTLFLDNRVKNEIEKEFQLNKMGE